MDGGKHRPHFRTEHPGQRHRVPLDRGDLDPHLAQGGRHLGADEAQSQHHRAAPGCGRGTDPVAILDSAELKDPGKIAARRRQRPVAPPGGHEEPVVGHRIPALQRDDLACRIDGGGADAKPKADALLSVERGRVDQLVLEPVLAAQVALGERRPIVRQLLLRPDQRDLALEASLTQRGGRAAPGQRSPDDDELPTLHRPAPPRRPSC